MKVKGVITGTNSFLRHVLDWKLRYRSAEELRCLAAASKFGDSGISPAGLLYLCPLYLLLC